MSLRSNQCAQRHAGQPPTAPFCRRETFGLTGGDFSPARGRGWPFACYIDRKDKASGSGAALCTKAIQ
jgi:hypothetical protein